MERGIVRLFKDVEGYGFITPSESSSPDVFFHKKQCGEYCPSVGDPVEFALVYDRQGRPRATTVRAALAPVVEQ